MALVVGNLLAPEGPPAEALARHLGVPVAAIRVVDLLLRALDSRQKVAVWRHNYRVELSEGVEGEVLARKIGGVRLWTERDRMRREGPSAARLRWCQLWPVVVVGAGPAGLFAALRLGEAGVPVVLVDRGGPVEDRVPAVNRHWRGGPLDEETNLLFGEGGAGTFSDGKIYTRRRDGELGYIFRVLVDCGADPEILQETWAHIGTDKVRALLPKLRERLRANGVEVRYHTRLVGIKTDAGRVVGVELLDREGARSLLQTERLLIATGHSARDTMKLLLDAGASAVTRPIAIGARIEHPQALIDAGRYGHPRGARPEALPPASYRLAYNPPSGRSSYTFCMCPGGMVVPANHATEQVVVNGMSFAARRAVWANSAVIVQVYPEDYPGTDPEAGLRFQAAIEAAAWQSTGGAGAPAQRADDFLEDRLSTELPRTSYPMGVVPVDLRRVLPPAVIVGMKQAIREFDHKVPGFAGPEGVLIAPETRTTSPLRFVRGEDLQSTSLGGLYPVGEGAGYAGGIISAALDGHRAAEAVMAREGTPR